MARKSKFQGTPTWRTGADPEIEKREKPLIPAWLDEPKTNGNLTPLEFRAFCHIARRQSGKIGYGKKAKGYCHDTMQTFATACGVSQNTLRKAIDGLFSKGLIYRLQRPMIGPGEYQTNLFAIVPKGRLALL